MDDRVETERLNLFIFQNDDLISFAYEFYWCGLILSLLVNRVASSYSSRCVLQTDHSHLLFLLLTPTPTLTLTLTLTIRHHCHFQASSIQVVTVSSQT